LVIFCAAVSAGKTAAVRRRNAAASEWRMAGRHYRRNAMRRESDFESWDGRVVMNDALRDEIG
jgi:hypothetical protein